MKKESARMKTHLDTVKSVADDESYKGSLPETCEENEEDETVNGKHPLQILLSQVQNSFDQYCHSIKSLKDQQEFFYVVLNGYKLMKGNDLKFYLSYRKDLDNVTVRKTHGGYELDDKRDKNYSGGGNIVKDKIILQSLIF